MSPGEIIISAPVGLLLRDSQTSPLSCSLLKVGFILNVCPEGTQPKIDKERDAISMVVEQSSLTCEWYLSHINYHLSSRGHHSFVISVFTSTRRCQPVRGHSHVSMLSLGHPHEPGELNVFA